ncbi:DUF1569 domain-containing protein [Cellulophaga sp. HaHaR_3_176]|uniref:DUF1569 domain-containing protein n=1 Tax=Cellulophaga sp. HaHaR_3_176 TaxID=1942464 RepID=UPI001C1F7475|nr:DUF1569 domain-containing protein [Cellulophaga sp. HaHaR_3_176]QWX82957.1 DUF1569 domain-containing protein [Cellulophaga sp. HaHaR_3_176]
MKSIFDETTKLELIDRINLLTEESERQWGKMTVAQMVWHCQYPLKVAVENKNVGNGNLFVRLFLKKAMYNDKVWRQNLPTSPQLKTTENKNLKIEAEILKQLTIQTHKLKIRNKWNPHPLFGKLTKEEWGKMEYKHLDHHLTQFGV